MSREVAKSAVTRLVTGARRGDQVHLGFIGGEPLLNRPVLHDAVELAIRLGAELGVAVEFGITTNGTLLTKSDIEYLEEHHFTVTISLDGVGEAHDRLRKTRHGHGTYERIIDRIGPWLAERRRTYVLARVTVTPINMQLAGTLDQLMELGFDGVAFAPLLHAPSGHFELDVAGLSQMLADLIACGERFERAVGEGRRYPFLNMERTLRDLHQGSSRSLPCGAVASYLGASAEGGLFACHRFVNDEAGWMGDVNSGIDDSRRMGWLRERNVDRQEPCRSCWARYLCGGGCHHELLHRGRVACDFIRGWWHYALQAYVRLLDRRPDFFAPAGNDTTARVQGRSVLLDTHSGR